MAKTKEAGGQSTYYLSYSKEMTQQFARDCAFWAKHINAAALELEEVVLKDEDKDITVYRVRRLRRGAASGFEIWCLPSVARSLRSKQGRVIIDEAAFVDDLDELKKAAMALLMWGGCVRILSTHNGDDNPFNELVKEIRDKKWDYSLHRTTTRWNKAYTGASALCKKKNGLVPARKHGARKLSTATVTEELFCIPVRAGTRYFPSSLIESVLDGSAAVARKTCEDGFTFEKEERRIKEFKAWLESEVRDILKTHTGPVYIGEDFARSGDLTCILSQFRLALDELQPDGKPFLAIELRNVPFAQQWQTILYLMDTLPNFSGGAFDGRGNGQMIAELRNGPAMWSR